MEHYNDGSQYLFPIVLTEFKDTDSQKELSWFSKVGTPVPSDSAFKQGYVDDCISMFHYNVKNILNNDGQVNYSSFLCETGRTVWEFDKEASKQYLFKVIEITENDKYNENRLKAEKLIKNEF